MVFIFSMLYLLSCNNKVKKENIIEQKKDIRITSEIEESDPIKTDEMREYIIPEELKIDSQLIIDNCIEVLKWYWSSDDEGYNPMIREVDLLIGVSMQHALLKEKKFQFVDDSTFSKRINSIFGFNINDKNNKYLWHTNDFVIHANLTTAYNCTDLGYKQTFFDTRMHNLYFFKKYNLFTGDAMTAIDYSPESDDNKIRFEISDRDYHENNYVLNDSKSSLTWLINNDYYFLEDLVKNFGYDKEPKINKAVLNKIFKEYQVKKQDRNVSKNLFFRKDCNGNLQIREGLMQFIVSESTTKSPGTLKILEDYGYDLGYNDPDSQELFKDLTPNEKDKLAAYIFYYVHKAYKKNDIGSGLREWNPASVLYNISVSNPELIERFKDNHYYNLPDFDEMIYEVELQIAD